MWRRLCLQNKKEIIDGKITHEEKGKNATRLVENGFAGSSRETQHKCTTTWVSCGIAQSFKNLRRSLAKKRLHFFLWLEKSFHLHWCDGGITIKSVGSYEYHVSESMASWGFFCKLSQRDGEKETDDTWLENKLQAIKTTCELSLQRNPLSVKPEVKKI